MAPGAYVKFGRRPMEQASAELAHHLLGSDGCPTFLNDTGWSSCWGWGLYSRWYSAGG